MGIGIDEYLRIQLYMFVFSLIRNLVNFLLDQDAN